MTLTLLSLETYRQHVDVHYGGLPGRDIEMIAEVMRRELLALGYALRWTLEMRVQALLSHFGVTREDVSEARRTLESIGDLQSGPGREIAPAPFHGVQLSTGRWLVVGTLPSSEIRQTLQLPVRGLPRRVSTEDEERLRRFVEEMGGRVLDVARFCGLDHAPLPQAFLEELQERLESAGRYHDRTSALAWDDLEVFEPAPTSTKVWRNVPLGELSKVVRAKQAGPWFAYGWARQTNEKRSFVPLSPDEARRATLVARLRDGQPAILPSVRTAFGWYVHLPVLLPAAEYRWLAAMGEMLDAPRRVRLDETTYATACAMLKERLGVVVEEGS